MLRTPMRARVDYWLAPGLRSVEMTAADYLAQRFSRHWHSGFAIGAVTRHAQGFHADGRAWVIAAGDLIVLNPAQVHDGHALAREGWSSRMAYIPEADFGTLAGVPGLGMAMRFTQAVVHSPALCECFVQWHRLSQTTTELRGHPLTAQLFAGLRQLMRPRTAGEDDRRRQLLAPTGPVDASAARLSASLALSRSGAWRRIRGEFGLAPKPLLSHLRLMSAKRLLAQGLPVIEAALDAGYHDQSHFSRQFAAAYGFTPAQFRRAQLA